MTRLRNVLKCNRGFALAEVLIGLAIFSAVALPGLRYLYKSTSQGKLFNLQQGMRIAQTEMELYLSKKQYAGKEEQITVNGIVWDVEFKTSGNAYKNIEETVSRKKTPIVTLKTGDFDQKYAAEADSSFKTE